MLFEQGFGTLPCQRDHLALDEPKAGADLTHLNHGSGCKFGGIRRHLFLPHFFQRNLTPPHAAARMPLEFCAGSKK
jgi:hypothetical protein